MIRVLKNPCDFCKLVLEILKALTMYFCGYKSYACFFVFYEMKLWFFLYGLHGYVGVHIEPYDFCEFDDDSYVSLRVHYMNDYVLSVFDLKILKYVYLSSMKATVIIWG